jgi:hypothetical protein
LWFVLTFNYKATIALERVAKEDIRLEIVMAVAITNAILFNHEI